MQHTYRSIYLKNTKCDCDPSIRFLFPTLFRSLQFSHSTDSPAKAMRRYLKTFAHVSLWHLADVSDHVTPSLGNKSVAVIRKAHIRVARAMDTRFIGTSVSLKDDMQMI